jgi:indole-3-glycerol phosphate synthase
MSILEDILRATEGEVAHRRSDRSIDELRRMALDSPPVNDLHSALLASAFSIIAEIKVRSPSAGAMDELNVAKAAKVYENSPAVSALSVITQESHFGGSLKRLQETRQSVTKPILRKDFIFDPYQVWEARAFGADAVLLMASVFAGKKDGEKRLRELYDLARDLGMSALVEIGMSNHPIEHLVSIIPEEATIWGANSRHFKSSTLKVRAHLGRLLGRDLHTDKKRHQILRGYIPKGRIAVAESGIDTGAQLVEVADLGYDAALIGSSLLRSGTVVEDAIDSLSEFVMAIRANRRRRSARL